MHKRTIIGLLGLGLLLGGCSHSAVCFICSGLCDEETNRTSCSQEVWNAVPGVRENVK